MAADDAGIRGNAAGAGQAEILLQMHFLGTSGREKLHAFDDFHETFLALALFVAGSGHLDAKLFRVIEQRRAGRSVGLLPVKMQLHAHETGLKFAYISK